MSDVKILHKPRWQSVGGDWQMIAGGKIIAALISDTSNAMFSSWGWRSVMVENAQDYSDHGWSNVEFDSLDDGKYCLEQWWLHMCRGQIFRR